MDENAYLLSRGTLPPVPNGDMDFWVAAYLGGPLALAWLIAENSKVLGISDLGQSQLWQAFFLTLGLLLAALLSSPDYGLYLWFLAAGATGSQLKHIRRDSALFAGALSPSPIHLRTFLRFGWVLPALVLGVRFALSSP